MQLTLIQTAPITGAIVVTTPSDVSLEDARKAVHMFHQVKVPMLGIVENMSYLICPHCNERVDVFSDGGGQPHGGARWRFTSWASCRSIPQVRIGGDTGKPIVLRESAKERHRVPGTGPPHCRARGAGGRVAGPEDRDYENKLRRGRGKVARRDGGIEAHAGVAAVAERLVGGVAAAAKRNRCPARQSEPACPAESKISKSPSIRMEPLFIGVILVAMLRSYRELRRERLHFPHAGGDLVHVAAPGQQHGLREPDGLLAEPVVLGTAVALVHSAMPSLE